MYRLIQYFLDEQITWTDLFGQRNELPVAEDPYSSQKKQVRTKLTPEQYFAFTQRAEASGSTTAIVLRQLVLCYITGKIGKGDIWY
jgi:hypothetical protein